jgi:hypothetical protein
MSNLNFTLETVYDVPHLCFSVAGVKYGVRVSRIPTEEDVARARALQYVDLKFGDRPEFIATHDRAKDWSFFLDSAGDLKRTELVTAVREFYA